MLGTGGIMHEQSMEGDLRNEPTYLSWGDGADATEARADSPGREKLLLFCCCWYCCCRRALDDCVEVDEGRERS